MQDGIAAYGQLFVNLIWADVKMQKHLSPSALPSCIADGKETA